MLLVRAGRRPIQVTVGASSITSQIIRKGKILRNSADFQNFFYISPNITLSERKERKQFLLKTGKKRGSSWSRNQKL